MTKKEFTFGKIWYIITEKEFGESTMLDEQNVVPLYKQLIGELEGKIAQGIYQPGEQLMPESDMAKSFGVSLITVRKALKELVDKGLIERQQGKGTFVAKKKYPKNLSQVMNFSELCRISNVKPGGKMLENALITADDKLAEKMGLKSRERVIYIKRVRFADGEPVAIEENYFPLHYAKLLEQQFDDNSLYEYLEREYHIKIAYTRKKIEICRANKQEAECLNVLKNEPLLLITSMAYTEEGELCYRGKQLIDGERFALYV